MELEEDKGEVSFSMKIKNFSTYEDFSQTFTSEFPLSVNTFRSQWSLTVSPFDKDNICSGEDSIHRDIGITLQCLRCNVNIPKIEVYCEVLGRDQHEKQLAQTSTSDLTWKGILTTRLSLKVFKLLKDDALLARLRFEVKGSDMARAVGGVESVASQMGQILECGEHSDVDILTSDGARIPAHSAILSCRSNLLQRISAAAKKRIRPIESTPERDTKCPRVDHFPAKTETPINSTFGSISSGYQTSTSMNVSPDSCHALLGSVKCKMLTSPVCLFQSKERTPSKSNVFIKTSQPESPNQALFKPKTTPSKLFQDADTASVNKRPPTPHKATPIKPSLSSFETSPVKNVTTPRRLSPSKKLPTPKRVSNYRLSLTPGKVSSVKSSTSSRRSSTCKYPPTPKSCSPSRRMTPVMVSLNKHMPLRRTPMHGPSPRRRLYEDASNPCLQDDNKDLKLPISGMSVTSSTTLVTSKSPFKVLQCVLFDDSPKNDNFSLLGITPKQEISVNMSASVTRAILEWIYTGECNQMDRLARALLVGGSRHGILDLAKACEYHLAAALTPTNAPETLFLAYKYKTEILKEAALDYAVKKAADVTSQPQWPTVSEKAPNLLLEFSRRLALHSQTLARENDTQQPYNQKLCGTPTPKKLREKEVMVD